MISVHTTSDFSLLRQLIADDRIRAALGDDDTGKTPDLNDFVPPGSKLYQVDDDERPVGVFVFRPRSDGVFEMHTIMSPACRGRKAIIAGQKAIASVKEAGAKSLVSYAFSDSPASLWFAHQIGFESVGRSQYPHTRNGRSVEIVHLLAKNS